ncbi:ribonuclease mrp protein subunit snm1 [Anaeramoeba flamelloides]|uniref:Ribonuclease mrp protein subunit snm1 n=1 Tax=Anaeramoeba flamelloides TaxID=1746091 RepID=A0ABQ8XTK7_9EUKA|nr:ribonuclease mrp protein subunit snm1 [Anaeramoeba flamelloides]
MTEEDNTTTDLMIKDLVGQMGSLLYYRGCLEKKIQIEDLGSLQKDHSKYFEGVKKLSTLDLTLSEVNEKLFSLRETVVLSTFGCLQMMLMETFSLFSIDHEISQFGIKKSKKSKSKPVPSTNQLHFDRVEKHEENSGHFFAMKMVYLTLKKLVVNKNLNYLAEIENETIDTIFEQINFVNSWGVRFVAIQCLGFLTKCENHLGYIPNKFVDFFQQKFKKSMLPWLSIYEKALKYINFNLSTETTSEISIKFLDGYCKLLKKVSNEQRKQEICVTIISLFEKLLPKHTQIQKDVLESEKQYFLNKLIKNQSKLYESLMGAYEICYDTVKKWLKKTKHPIVCYQCLEQLLQVSSLEFYSNESSTSSELKGFPDFLNLLQTGIKNKETRFYCLIVLRDLIQNIHVDYLRDQETKFIERIKELIPIILIDATKKNQNLIFEEIEFISDILYQICLKCFSFGIDLIKENFENPKLRLDYKIAIARSIVKLCQTNPDSMYDVSDQLYPILDKILIGTKITQELISQGYDYLISEILQTFPTIMGEDIDREEILIKYIVNLALLNNEEISSQSIKTLERYLNLSYKEENDGSFFMNAVFPLMDRIETINYFNNLTNSQTNNVLVYQNLETLIIKMFTLLTSLIDCFQNFLKNCKKNFIPDFHFNEWSTFIIRFQSCCLIWLNFNNGDLKNLILDLFKKFQNQEFQSITDKLYQKKLRKEKRDQERKNKNKSKKGKRRRRRRKDNDSEESEKDENEENVLQFDEETNKLTQSMSFIKSLSQFLIDNNYHNNNQKKEDDKEKQQQRYQKQQNQQNQQRQQRDQKGVLKNEKVKYYVLTNWIKIELNNYKISFNWIFNTIANQLFTEQIYLNIQEFIQNSQIQESPKSIQNNSILTFYFQLFGMLCSISTIPKKMNLIPETLEIKKFEKSETNTKNKKKKKKQISIPFIIKKIKQLLNT